MRDNIDLKRNRGKAPLFWVAISITVAFAISKFLNFDFRTLGYYIFLSIAGVILSYQFFGSSRRINSYIVLVVISFLGGIAYYVVYEKSFGNVYPSLVSREFDSKLFIKTCDRNLRGDAYGVAVVEEASELGKLEGCEIWYYIKSSDKKFVRGEVILAKGFLYAIDKGSDFDNYLQNRGVFFKFKISSIDLIYPLEFPYDFYEYLRCFINKKLSKFSFFGSDSEAKNAYSAMVLGDKSMLSPDLENAFKSTGTMHIFAVSGLHVGLVAGIMYMFVKLINMPFFLRPFLVLPILFLYVNICGARPSSVRAFMMIVFIWLAYILRRNPKPFAGLSLAFFISILFNPNIIFDPGFALSYGIVCVILLYAIPFNESFLGYLYDNGYFLRETIMSRYAKLFLLVTIISFSTILVSFPLSSYFFSYVAPLSVPYSILYVICAGIVVACGVISSILPNFLSPYINDVAGVVLDGMIRFAKIGASFEPIVSVHLSGVITFILVVALCISFVLLEGKRGEIRFGVPLILSFFTMAFAIFFKHFV